MAGIDTDCLLGREESKKRGPKLAKFVFSYIVTTVFIFNFDWARREFPQVLAS